MFTHEAHEIDHDWQIKPVYLNPIYPIQTPVLWEVISESGV